MEDEVIVKAKEEKVISLTVNEGTYYRRYLQLFYFALKLTDKELDVLEKIIELYYEGEYNFLNSTNRMTLTNRLEFSSTKNLNNYIKTLKDKKAIISDMGIYVLNPVLIPPLKGGDVKINFKWK